MCTSRWPCSDCPLQCGEQPVVFRDVVGGDAERTVQLLNQVALGVLDADAVAGRSRVAPGAAVDVGANHDALGAGLGGR